MTVPPGYSVHTGKGKPRGGYIAICHDDSLVCITYPPGHYKGTTFDNASVEVTLLPPKTEQACMNPGKYEVSTLPEALFRIDAKSPIRMIGGVRFLHARVGAGAMSHDIVGDVYRGFTYGRCYELAVLVTFTNFAAFPPGRVKEFTPLDEKHIIAQLTRILDSFRTLH